MVVYPESTVLAGRYVHFFRKKRKGNFREIEVRRRNPTISFSAGERERNLTLSSGQARLTLDSPLSSFSLPHRNSSFHCTTFVLIGLQGLLVCGGGERNHMLDDDDLLRNFGAGIIR